MWKNRVWLTQWTDVSHDLTSLLLIIIVVCDVSNELTSRTYGEKKWWVVIVKDQSGFSRRETFCIRSGSGKKPASF